MTLDQLRFLVDCAWEAFLSAYFSNSPDAAELQAEHDRAFQAFARAREEAMRHA